MNYRPVKKEIKSNENISNEKNVVKESNKNLTIVSKSKKYISYQSKMSEMYQELKKLLELKDEIKELIKREKLRENIIKVQELQIKKFDGELQVKSIKIYKEVIDEFNTFMENHKELKQQDVISQALWEFLKKYK